MPSFCRSHIKRPDMFRKRVQVTATGLATYYGFPTPGGQGAVPIVAIVSLGGGFAQADNVAYCQRYSIPVQPCTFISVMGATNAYSGNPNSADGENALDIQNVMGGSRGTAAIRFYGGPNTSAGFIAILKQIIADIKAGIYIVAVTISWGQAESGWSFQDMTAMENCFAQLKALGVPCFAASGDDGSSDGGSGNNADFPASSPSCFGVGGTSLVSTETAWSYGGGGPSHVWKANSWAPAILGTMRNIPDLSSNADPNSGYPIYISGSWGTFGGTSAVGPLLAGAIALCCTNTGKRVGDITNLIYSGVLTDITTGSNGAYSAKIGPDFCTGEGVPNAKFWQAIMGVPSVPPPPPPPPPPPTQPPPTNPPVGGSPTQGDIIGKINSIMKMEIARAPMLGHPASLLQRANADLVSAISSLYPSHSVSDLRLILKGIDRMIQQSTLAALQQAASDNDAAAQATQAAGVEMSKAQQDTSAAATATANAQTESLVALGLVAADLGIPPGTPIPGTTTPVPAAPAMGQHAQMIDAPNAGFDPRFNLGNLLGQLNQAVNALQLILTTLGPVLSTIGKGGVTNVQGGPGQATSRN